VKKPRSLLKTRRCSGELRLNCMTLRGRKYRPGCPETIRIWGNICFWLEDVFFKGLVSHYLNIHMTKFTYIAWHPYWSVRYGGILLKRTYLKASLLAAQWLHQLLVQPFTISNTIKTLYLYKTKSHKQEMILLTGLSYYNRCRRGSIKAQVIISTLIQ